LETTANLPYVPGELVPIPTLPAGSMRTRSPPLTPYWLVLNAMYESEDDAPAVVPKSTLDRESSAGSFDVRTPISAVVVWFLVGLPSPIPPLNWAIKLVFIDVTPTPSLPLVSKRIRSLPPV